MEKYITTTYILEVWGIQGSFVSMIAIVTHRTCHNQFTMGYNEKGSQKNPVTINEPVGLQNVVTTNY